MSGNGLQVALLKQGNMGPKYFFPWPKKALGCNELSRYVL